MAARSLITLVDDEPSVRTALTRLLKALEFNVEAFASGQEFLDSLARRRPDCVVLDVHMPGLSGRDIQRRLIADWPELPIIVVSAHDDPLARRQCLTDGAVACLSKPLHAESLLASIQGALKR